MLCDRRQLSRMAEPPLKNLSYYEQDIYGVTFTPNNDGTPWAHRIIEIVI